MLIFYEPLVSSARHIIMLAIALRSFCNQAARYLFVTSCKKQLFL
ncbi:hypothetical protein X564_11570 [Pseudoalteromonas agarivorans]|nr:hypothetical protein X564_11570 [Pseudoalteromonas agarivorans]